jgi:Na+/proline symporter
MKIDKTTIAGSIILFIVSSVFFSFVSIKTNPTFLQNKDEKSNKFKAISFSIGVSLLFTAVVAYISMKADKENLLKAKKI